MQWNNYSKHKSSVSLKFYIKIKVIKWSPYNPDLNPIVNVWGNTKRYLDGKTNKDIKNLKEDILDQ